MHLLKIHRKIKTIYYMVITFLLLILASLNISYTSYIPTNTSSSYNFFKPVIEKLYEKGADSVFIAQIISNQNTVFNEKYIKINVSGYLKKADYSHNYSNQAIFKCREFIYIYWDELEKCERQYKVPKEIITAILWIETKHGQILGKNNLLSVFMSTAMADQPIYVDLNILEMRKYFKGDSIQIKEMEKKIIARAKKKSNWAIKELLAMNKIFKKNKYSLFDINGSWAGAFGIPQFLPSSYFSFAIDGNNDGIIDLFNIDDAMFSVANYLKTNGWANNSETQRKAVFHYNNSNDYVDAVFIIAKKLGAKIDISLPLNRQLQGN